MNIRNLVLSATVGVATLSSGTVYGAGVFTVNPANMDATYTSLLSSFQSDYIAGNYLEVVTIKAGNTFSWSLAWTGTQFNLGGVAVQDGLNPTGPSTGLNNSYVLYATMQGTGTYTQSGSTITFDPTPGGSLNLYAAKGVGFTAPASGDNLYTIMTAGAVHTLLTGAVTAAAGTLKQGTGNDFGSFDVGTSAALVNPDGDNFFTAPLPFFNASFEAGNFNNYWLPLQGGNVVLGTYPLSGSAQITFGSVPEPPGLALAGLALAAAGLASRRRKV